MAEQHGTGIEWTHIPGFKGETWNPVTGCSRVSTGCINCYAETVTARYAGQPGWIAEHRPWTTPNAEHNVRLRHDRLDTPRQWTKPRAVFVNSMSDLFHELVPPAFIAEVFATMAATPQHVYLILTKRPERMREVLSMTPLLFYVPLPNVWLGVSIENARYTWRADVLRDVPAARRFISAEPLLGSLFKDSRPLAEFAPAGSPIGDDATEGDAAPRAARPLDLTAIDWVIVGGESGGQDSRPMHPEWARELRDACQIEASGRDDGYGAAEPAYFFKQWGSWSPGGVGDILNTRVSTAVTYDGKTIAPGHATPGDEIMVYRGPNPKAGGKHLDGSTWCEIPPVEPQLSIA